LPAVYVRNGTVWQVTASACLTLLCRAKEFEGIEGQPTKQISRLKEILEDLGMTGRLSMEKAKSIRAKRELAEEIGKLLVVTFYLLLF
jgi:hypothetical protein